MIQQNQTETEEHCNYSLGLFDRYGDLGWFKTGKQ